MKDQHRANVRAVKVGDRRILGTDQDFPKSPVEVLSVAYNDKMELHKRRKRKAWFKGGKSTLRNRFDRMKSYHFKRGVDWRLDYEDYRRLWETAPEVFDKESGRMVHPLHFADRRGKVRACRINQLDRVVDYNNICLKHKGKIIHTLK